VARIGSSNATTTERSSQHLELLDVAKHFGGVRALAGVSLSIRRGSIHALVGENGAGKSTLGRIIAGALAADGGTMFLDGAAVAFGSPREALEHKVAAIAQEPSVVPQLTVAENVYLGVEPRRSSFIRKRRLRQDYAALAESAGFVLPGGLTAGRLRTAEQQKVEILRALSRDAQLIVMDEPSAALDAHETQQLHEIIRRLAASGKTILLISHFLGEVLELADTVTVLRDGRLVKTAATSTESESSLVEAMLGRPLTLTFPEKRAPADEAPVLLSVRGIHAPGVQDVSLEVRAGEIVGLAGLVGAGRTELARAIFGAAPIHAGEVVSSTGRAAGRSPRKSIQAGLTLIPESRKDQGLIFGRSVIENTTLSRLDELSAFGVVRRRAERKAAQAVLERCDVRGAAYSAPVGALSGGNQQKVLLARMLLCEPRVLLADEPTRGVDVGAKRAIYDFLVTLAEEGIGIVLISSELEEILGLAHRVLVMRRGRIAAELEGDGMSEGAILAAAFADQSAGGAAA
jgi:simple sugar transport system ATP-binding protein/ribose transport system ATP-binding protein